MKLTFKFISDWIGPWREYVAEFLGTFLFVFMASSVVAVSKLYDNLGILPIAFAIGFSYISLIYACQSLSSGFLNPAITIALWLTKKISGSRTVFYLISQIAGSFLAAGLVALLFGSTVLQLQLGGPVLGLGVLPQTAMAIEALVSAGLVFIVFATIVDKRGNFNIGPLAVGLYLVAATVVFWQLTGASFNPIRALGPLVLSHAYSTLAIFVIGPLIGSLAAIVYEYVFVEPDKKK